MQMSNALNIDFGQPNMHNENPPMDTPLGGLFRQLLSYIEREFAYSNPIRGFLYLAKDSSTLNLYDTYNIDPQVAAKCDTLRKGECHCGAAFSLQKTYVINHISVEDTIQCEGIHPNPHIIIPIWHHTTLVGLANISLPNSNEQVNYSNNNYPAIFDLVSGFLGAVVANDRPEKKTGKVDILFNAADGMILDLDKDGKVISMHSETNLLNVNVDSLIGYMFSDHFVGQDKQEIDNALVKLSAGACKKVRREYEFKDRYGESKTIELSIYPCFHDGRRGGFTVVCRDIESQRKSAFL